MVVGIEPLRQLHRPRRLVARAATRHGEEEIEVDRVARPAEAGRNGADQRAGIEHLVVEGEVVDRDEIEPGSGLGVPVGAADGRRRLLQLRGGALAGPVAFQRPLQLAPLADARVSRDGSQGHSRILRVVSRESCIREHHTPILELQFDLEALG